MITLDEQIEWVHRELKQSEEQGWKGSVAACTAILATLRSVKQAEPVAWMLTEIGPLGKGAKVARTSKPIAWDKTQWKLEPLYAAPPPPQHGGTRQRG